MSTLLYLLFFDTRFGGLFRRLQHVRPAKLVPPTFGFRFRTSTRRFRGKLLFPCFSIEIQFGYVQMVHLLLWHVLGEDEPDLFLLCIEERELILECPHSSMTIHIDQHCQCFLQTPCRSTFSSIPTGGSSYWTVHTLRCSHIHNMQLDKILWQ